MPENAQSEPADVHGIPGEWVSGRNVSGDGAILYLHGGGYVIGSIDTHRGLAARLSMAANARVLVVDYRLAPEHPFPAAVDDALTAYRWLLEAGFDASNLAVAGDSAGGGLTVAALIAARNAGLPRPGAAVCISPWVDMEALGESMQTKADADPMVQKAGILRMAGFYLGDADPRDPLAAPMHADLSGLPPLLIQVGSAETLLSDSIRLADKAREDGVAVTLEESSDMIHVWHLFAPMLSEGQEAIERAGAFITEHVPSD